MTKLVMEDLLSQWIDDADEGLKNGTVFQQHTDNDSFVREIVAKLVVMRTLEEVKAIDYYTMYRDLTGEEPNERVND